MLDTREIMVLIKGEIKTSQINSCRYNYDTNKMDVEYKNGKTYSYACSHVECLTIEHVLGPNECRVSREGREFFNIQAIYVFKSEKEVYYHILFGDGSERDYCKSELKIEESCLGEKKASDVFAYLKQVAKISDITNEYTGEKMLEKKFEKISFVGNETALAKYLNPSSMQMTKRKSGYIPIFPFGCNNSQYEAVLNAMENQISVIQGPPGTGKTQTILNIIANILMQGKTVQIVSNNNSATGNVYEKLSSSKYGLGFVAATLGSSDNKRLFISQQNENYPDFSKWKIQEDGRGLQEEIAEKSIRLRDVFHKEEQLARLSQEYAQLTVELKYFEQYMEESDVVIETKLLRKNLSSEQWMELWQECQLLSEKKQKIGILFLIRSFLRYGIGNRTFYRQKIAKIITTFQAMYYREKAVEMEKEIEEIEKDLANAGKNLVNEMSDQSMAVLKNKLAEKYACRKKRRIFEEDDLWKKSGDVLNEYPVILSTTFSSRNSLNSNIVYDYLIMDEASQVDVATGALALSCAKNVVIVGDTKQLPNVVKGVDREKADAIFDSFDINQGYRFTNSFLQSILDIIPDVTQTMLREHYRCHPKIINFCNQKFYRGELIVMTKDKGEKDVLTVVKTVPGNHARDHYSQRQIDVIKKEIIPKYVTDKTETGIIAPYKNQVEALETEIRDIDAATVHKFQGKEKDMIIISTVDDEISDFADDPYLINVAVSRAKKKLMLVVTGNEQNKERNITDLIDYIQYNNFEVVDSKVYSIFDYLYKQYTQERKLYLQKHKKVSEYDSENLMYSLLEEILSNEKYASYDVVCHFPMNMLIRNLELLNDRECQYAMNPATHIDFLLYNRISKKPLLAVEVDGYGYHKKHTVQDSRDQIKDHILELYGIPLLRFRTNGSGEKKILMDQLDALIG